MIKKPPETYRAFVDRLADLFDQIPPEDIEEAEQELRDAGVDPEAIGQRMKNLAEQTLARSRLNWRAEAAAERRHALDKLTHFAARIPEARSGLEIAIREILERSPHLGNLPAVTAHFRNFAEATDEDLRSLLLELEFLRMQAEEDSKDKDK
jgi:hypothetical protein